VTRPARPGLGQTQPSRTAIILFQMDVIHGLTLSEIHPDAVTTAYGPLADFITIAREEAARG